MSSWRKATRYKYELVLRKWEKFCTKRGSDPYNTNVNNILEFLTELYEKGNKYSSICSARSALATVVKIDSYSSISDHPLVSQFVKGVYNLHPPFPRYTHTWDVNKVLTYIVNMPDNSELTFKQLTQKLVILL